MSRLPGLSEFIILSAISKGKKVPVRDIRNYFQNITEKEISRAAAYISLGRLAAKHWVIESVTSDKNIRGSRKIAVYDLTPAGEKMLEITASALRKILI